MSERSDEEGVDGGRGRGVRIGQAFVEVLRRAADEIRRRRRLYGAVWATAAVVTLVAYPFDQAILTSVQNMGASLYRWAGPISEVGKFENSSLLFAVVLAIVGMLTGKVRWRQAAAACLIAGIVSGLAVTVLRPALGRARPHAEQPSGFHFLEIDSALHSMPSGHATTNTASAAAIVRVFPAAGLPVAGFALAVCWSRMQLNRHYPTDVLWGIVLGGTVGWAVGGAIAGAGPADRSRSSARS